VDHRLRTADLTVGATGTTDERVAGARDAARRRRAEGGRGGGGGVPDPFLALAPFWRWLRRMRTALYLLAALGVATLLATLIPQSPNVPGTVADWLEGVEGPGAGVSEVLLTLGLFDIYGSPWFIALLVLLFTSLTACLIPRYRAFARTVRSGVPPRTRDPDAKPHVIRFTTDASAAQVLAAARGLLQGSRYRLRPDDPGLAAAAPGPVRADARGVVVPAPADAPDAEGGLPRASEQMAAERGHVSREGGSLAFHSAFYLLLVGVIAGQLFGFRAHVGVVEGESFTDAPAGYWSNMGGRLWDDDWHRGFVFTLDEFEVDWTPDGQPDRFISHFTISPGDGGEPVSGDLRVNDPKVFDGMKIHQLDWGYAVRMVVRDGDDVAYDSFVPLTMAEEGFWRGAVKAPGADPGVGAEVYLFPTVIDDDDGQPVVTGWPAPRAPLVVLQAWEGDMQLERVQGIHDLDTGRMREIGQAGLRPGASAEIREGTTIEFADLRYWSGLQVSRRHSDPLLLAAAVLIIVALLPALYAYRRRIWVDVAEDDRGTVVTVSGQALQRPQAFEEEHRRVAEALREELDGRTTDRSGGGS
jgi:cytochrome c biogenesis protein